MSTYAPPATPDATPPTAPDSQPAEKKKTEPRPYHVFEEVQDGVLHFVKTVDATTPENAVKTLGTTAVGRKFAACPVRNWKVVEPKLRPESVTF